MIGLTLLVAITAADAGPGPVLQPGILVQPDLIVGSCTLGFALDGADGNVYFAHAAHCGTVGGQVSSEQIQDFGVRVYDDAWDFSLIRVHPQYAQYVSGTVKGHPGIPTGVTSSHEPNTGDLLRLSGYGLGYHLTPTTQEQRIGVVTPSITPDEYCAEAMVSNHDSGGPVIHAPTGKALGIVSRPGSSCLPPAALIGPTLAGGIARAAAAGYDLQIRTG